MKELLDLHAFADGELTQAESQKLRSFIDQNSDAQKEVNAILNLVDCLKQKSPNHESEECWTTCVGRLNQLDRSKKVEGFVGRYAWAMCAVLFVLVLGGRFAVKDVHGDSAHTADLVKIFHTSQPDPVRQLAQQQFYSSLLRRSKQARSGVKVLDHRYGTVLDTSVERLDIADKNGPLIFFIMNGVFNFEDASQISSGSGLSEGIISNPSIPGGDTVHCVIWVDHGQTFVLAGPRPVQTLSSAAVDLGLKSSNN